jgi:four helix bundle protein
MRAFKSAIRNPRSAIDSFNPRSAIAASIRNPKSQIRNPMTPTEFKRRTFDYGARIVRLVQVLPKNDAARDLGRQLLRSGTSVGANYRAATRARSKAEFLAKLGIVEEECDETLYWLEMLCEVGLIKPKRLELLHAEGSEILSMVVASITTARPRAKAVRARRSNPNTSKKK